MKSIKEMAADGSSLFRKGVRKQQEERMNPKLEPWMHDVSEKLLHFAEEVRRMGSNGRDNESASAIARKLEQTADYLKYRPASSVAADALESIEKKHVVTAGIAAGLAVCSAAVAYKYWCKS